jgi:hypothetical protein
MARLWGFGLCLTTDFNPHLVSCRAGQSDTARRCNRRVITMRWLWLLPSQVRVVKAVRSRSGALPETTC